MGVYAYEMKFKTKYFSQNMCLRTVHNERYMFRNCHARTREWRWIERVFVRPCIQSHVLFCGFLTDS